jgi:hypothetical protein
VVAAHRAHCSRMHLPSVPQGHDRALPGRRVHLGVGFARGVQAAHPCPPGKLDDAHVVLHTDAVAMAGLGARHKLARE